MSIKKKMSMGILAGTLGVSLIGGGTWAAFNDVEGTSNTIAAGTLDLVVGDATTMDFVVKNLKPGDTFTKNLVLNNNGSLDINQIKVHATKEAGWEDKDELGLATKIAAGAGSNNEDDFLEQFKVLITDGSRTAYSGTLKDLANGTGVGELTGTDAVTKGLAAGAGDKVYNVKIEFKDDPATFANSRLQKQNKYQGEMSNLKFVFEATQMPGEDRSNN